ncbi:MAG: FAD-binding protein [Prevotella sp.]|nr:FAD-binding protein [Prevotella sp.]
MIQEYQLRLLPQQACSEQAVIEYIAREKGFDARTINKVRVLKRSVDARQRTIYVNLKVRAYINELPQDEEYVPTVYPYVGDKPQVIVVGAGPGGLFASLRLIESGFRPVVVERGKDVRERKKDLAMITKTQRVDAESNYCFGEGGAGAYSDGKLYTRSKKRGSVDKILNVFCQHGASTSILADAHPHIGTDRLPMVIENMRNTILKSGGEVHFQTKMQAFLTEGDRVVGIEAVSTAEDTAGRQRHFRGPVILATGHSARDVYRYLAASRIEIEPKGIAVGVRLEHPSALIDQIQYHNKNGRGRYLPAAEYSFVTQSEGRGVYSFCMCPGGFVIPAATGPQQIVVNGMSPSNRGTKWSNSGMVVEIRPEDVKGMMPSEAHGGGEVPAGAGALSDGSVGAAGGDAGNDGLLDVMHFQQWLERLCWQQGNMRQTAPAQRMADFVNGRLSYDLPRSSYAPGLVSSPLHFWMPSFISHRLQEGFKAFGRSAHGFLTNEAVLIAVETRTSSPVRIVRNVETLEHVRLHGLFPCGEGAGYAGGIVSAGIDGERCAEMCAAYLNAH